MNADRIEELAKKLCSLTDSEWDIAALIYGVSSEDQDSAKRLCEILAKPELIGRSFAPVQVNPRKISTHFTAWQWVLKNNLDRQMLAGVSVTRAYKLARVPYKLKVGESALPAEERQQLARRAALEWLDKAKTLSDEELTKEISEYTGKEVFHTRRIPASLWKAYQEAVAYVYQATASQPSAPMKPDGVWFDEFVVAVISGLTKYQINYIWSALHGDISAEAAQRN